MLYICYFNPAEKKYLKVKNEKKIFLLKTWKYWSENWEYQRNYFCMSIVGLLKLKLKKLKIFQKKIP